MELCDDRSPALPSVLEEAGAWASLGKRPGP